MLRPLGTLLGSLVAKVAPLVGQIGKFFSSLSGGKGILETFGALVGIAVVVPLKLLITQVQLGVDALTDFWDVGKRVANFFGADFQLDPNDSFGNLAKNVKANGQSILDTLTGQDAARAAAEKAAAEQRNRAAFDELSRRTSLQLEAEAKRRAQGQKAADRKADEAKNDLEAEYKAGAISKDKYEAQKAQIEANYDEQTRAAKQKAAETEKEYNIAQAIIQTALSIVKASPNPLLMSVAAVTGAASVAKILATPIPEFEKGGFFGRTWRGVKEYARGGRINTRAGVADVGQRHSGGGIRMVDGATGEHLGEWEKGEAYMILSRDTYANNKHLVDELIDTSLHRGGAPVRRREDYYEDGGTFGGSRFITRSVSTRVRLGAWNMAISRKPAPPGTGTICTAPPQTAGAESPRS